MACCRCSRTGHCQNCICVKRGSSCRGCLPQRLGTCVNTVNTQLSQAQALNTATPGVQNSQASSITLPPPSVTELPLPRGALEPNASANTSTSPATENPAQGTPESGSSCPELPAISPISDATYAWGAYDSASFSSSLDAAYEEVVHWRPNFFKLPYGKTGKSFTSELARLYSAFASGSAMQSIALKATVVLPILMLQKPSAKSKTKEHITCLERRLTTWQNGDLQDLILEGRTIQQRIPKPTTKSSRKHLARSFANLMFKGNTKAAIRLLTDNP